MRWIRDRFLDRTKAFDCDNHEKLLRKLEIYDIRGNQLEFMKRYSQNRKQKARIMIDSEIYVLDEEGIINGVPQGSVLGPFLFITHINDLPHYVDKSLNVITFVDDTIVVKI